MVKLPLINSNKYAIIDDEGLYLVAECNFHINDAGYVALTKGGKGKTILHRVISRAPKGVHVHHKNGNKLDNRKANLSKMSNSKHRAEHVRNYLKSNEFNQIRRTRNFIKKNYVEFQAYLNGLI